MSSAKNQIANLSPSVTFGKILTCPYCGYEQKMHEPEKTSADMCVTECESCGKIFRYNVQVYSNNRTYNSSTDDIDIEKEFISLLDNLTFYMETEQK